MNLGIAGKRALVCGASRGLGFACARALAHAGADLAMVARSAQGLDAAAQLIRDNCEAEVVTIAADLSTKEGCQRVREEVPERDILVTNCGGARAHPFAGLERDDWVSALNLNMVSALEMIGAYLPGMRERGFGRIVNILNVALTGGYPDLPLSSGATAGVAGAVSAIARSAARDGVTINNILPGRFETDRLSENIALDVATTGESEAEIRAMRLKRQAVQRFGEPSELGDLCAFLCSQSGGYLVNQNIVMDGGGYPYDI